MYVELSSAFFGMGDDLAKYAAQIEIILSAHRRRQMVFCLSPKDNQYLRAHSGIGPGALLVLQSMAKRAADYRAGAGLSKRFVTVQPDDHLPADFQILASGHLEVRLGYIVRKFDQSSPGLFVEHVENDRRAIELIFRLRCRALKIPDDLVVFRPVHGGGGTMADVLRVAHDQGLMGFGVADRDTYPSNPILCKTGGTADLALAALSELNVLDKSNIGFSNNDPLFGFILTLSRTIESYIGPHLLELYFDKQPQVRESRTLFLKAYKNFPDLTSDQYFIWMAKNLKDGGVSQDEIKLCVTNNGGQISSNTDMKLVSAATIPKSCVSWLTSEMDSRFRKDILVAFEKDCANATYERAVAELFDMAWDLLAADQRMKLA